MPPTPNGYLCKERTPKNTTIDLLDTYLVIPFWSGAQEGDQIYSNLLPGFQACPVLDATRRCIAKYFEHGSDRGFRRFVSKLFREGSYEALCVLATIEVVLNNLASAEDSCTRKNSHHNQPSSEEGDATWLVEGWPFIQELITWNAFVSLYLKVSSHLHMVTLPNPLTQYAKKTILYLSDQDFTLAMQNAVVKKWLPNVTANRIRVSQFFLDYAASLPSRIVGVILEDPNAMSYGIVQNTLQQSCVPSICLELSIDKTNQKKIVCSCITLYELERGEELTVSTRPSNSDKCCCASCSYEKDPSAFCHSIIEGKNISTAQRLAHVLFQKGKYEQAKELYRRCYDVCSNTSQKADLWHAIGAVELTRHRFIEAQRHWKKGSAYASHHPGIHLQLQKERAYEYLNPRLPSPEDEVSILEYMTLSPGRLFLASNFVSTDVCNKLINWAEQSTSKAGWTTSRHYAVPTIDVPVHQVPQLLDWFQNWMATKVQALLHDQFKTASIRHHFYVHDAFVAKYTATSKSHFLPLHYDESTHSMVLALNDNFEGGGTYIHGLDQTVSPRTGTLLSFRGDKLLHGGNVVTEGTRFILAVFLYLDDGVIDRETEAQLSKQGSYDIDEDRSKRRRTSPAGGNSGFSFGFF